MNYTDRVAKGAATLDDILPGWERKIDLEALHLGNECRCVLGQLSVEMQVPNDPERTRYFLALDAIMPHDEDQEWIDNHGFDLDPENDGAVAYRDLTEAWKRLIRQRLEA